MPTRNRRFWDRLYLRSDREVELSGQFRVATPFSLPGTNTVRGAVSVTRPFLFTYGEPDLDQSLLESGAPILGETLAAVATLADKTFLFAPPLTALFQENYTDRVLGASGKAKTVELESIVGVDLRRGIASGVAGLFVPVSLEVEGRRTISRVQDSESSTLSGMGRVGWSSANLFGRLGSAQFFSFYESDEYSLDLNINYDGQTEGMSTTGIGALSFAAFYRETSSLSIENFMHVEIAESTGFKDEVTVEFSSIVPLEGGIIIPFLNNLAVEAVYFEHQERFEASWSSIDNGFFAQFSHKTDVYLQDYIRISGQIAIGIDSRLRNSNLPEDPPLRSWNFGVEGALSVHITL